MKTVVFLTLLALYVLVVGQNWGIYSAALMLAAYLKHGGKLNEPIS